MGREDKHTSKINYITKIIQVLNEYPRYFLVSADNVSSIQMQQIRISLRGHSIMLMGNNTIMHKAIKEHLANNPALGKLVPHIKGKVGFVFTHGDLLEVRDKLLENMVCAPAKPGAIASVSVVIPAQITGLWWNNSSFFKALSIPIKISKGYIVIINDVHILKAGDRVGACEAAILNMLKISPHSYGLVVKQIYDNGTIFAPEIFDVKPEDVQVMFREGVANVAALSLAMGYPTVASAPHSIANGFKNLVAIAAVTEVEFKEAATIKEFIKYPPIYAAVAAEVKNEDVMAAKEEAESDDDMNFGLFD